ncbi:MAG: hypothetical protein DRN25_07700, partial [Thermoplasmata archaeon]
SGKTVDFYVNTSIDWHYIGSSTTNESGVADYPMIVTMLDGTYLFKAVFDGDTKFSSSMDIATITVVEDVAIIPILVVVGKAIVEATAIYLAEEYVFKPYVFTPVANSVSESSLPFKEYLDEPEEIQTYIDYALLAHNIRNLLKSGYKAAVQYGAAKQSTGKAVGGHMRWFWDYAKQSIGEFTEITVENVLDQIDDEVYENEGRHLTEDERKQIEEYISPYIRESNEAFLEKLASSTFMDAFIVDPTIGYTETIQVQDNVKRMRIYLGWNVSEYSEEFFILKDPDGNTIMPEVNVTFSTDPEAANVTVELMVMDPKLGNWKLWFNGSKLPNETVGVLIQFDKIFEVLPEHIPTNPGYMTNLTAIFQNFEDSTLVASLSFMDVPSGWTVTAPPYCPVLFPNSSAAMEISVVPPDDIRYGVNKTIKCKATIYGDIYVEPFTVHIIPLVEIERGIAYLHEKQLSDGSWQHNIGITSLATLAYLNAGYDETEEDVREGIDYILGHGHVHSDGTIYGDSNSKTYETSLATITLIATHNESYNEKIVKARDWLVASQWDEECLWGIVDEDNWYYGGFGYGRHIRPDLSNTQFALMALDAADLPKDDLLWIKAQIFLNRTQARDKSNDQMWANGRDTGGFIYVPDGSTAGGGSIDGYGSMTGAGIWGLSLCGVNVGDGRFEDAMKWVGKNYYWDRNPRMSSPGSGQFYYYLSMSKALTMAVGVGGKIEDHYWYDDLALNLTSLQEPEEGCWINSNGWAWENIPELATSYSLLSLETRIIPTDVSKLSYLTFVLHSNADLHVYDPLGRHVGINYDTGEVEIQIPNATYMSNGEQNITVPHLEAGNYRIVLVG